MEAAGSSTICGVCCINVAFVLLAHVHPCFLPLTEFPFLVGKQLRVFPVVLTPTHVGQRSDSGQSLSSSFTWHIIKDGLMRTIPVLFLLWVIKGEKDLNFQKNFKMVRVSDALDWVVLQVRTNLGIFGYETINLA